MPSTMSELVVLMRHERPRHVPLEPATSLTIGRSSTCDLPVRDRYISRQHARVWWNETAWYVRDLDSANGTWIDGRRIEADTRLEPGTRLRVGDTELEFHVSSATDRISRLPGQTFVPMLSIGSETVDAMRPGKRTLERIATFNSLMLESLEEQPYDELAAFILNRLMAHLSPSRCAIAQLDGSGTVVALEMKRAGSDTGGDLALSSTVVDMVRRSRRAIAWNDVRIDAELSKSRSLALQGVRSVACAPMIAHDDVIGILYVDFQVQQHAIDESELVLIAQVARFAAIRLENARLREDAMQRRLLEEELRTAASVQRQLLPDAAPTVPGWSFEARSVASRGVSGDYYDFMLQPDGRLWIVIGDVSGKGINAALLMASLQASFRIYVQDSPEPGVLCGRLNSAMKGLLPANRFITLFVARLDPASGVVEYANAGHQPPLVLRRTHLEALDRTDILLGMFPQGSWQTSSTTLQGGDALLLFTDGLTEIECGNDEELGDRRLPELLRPLHGLGAEALVGRLEAEVARHAPQQARTDDLTLVVATRDLDS